MARPSPRNTIDFTIWSSAQPASRAASCAVRVVPGISTTRAAIPEAAKAAVTRSRLDAIAASLSRPPNHPPVPAATPRAG